MKLSRKFLVTLIAFSTLNVGAGELDLLKKTPATKYEVGKMRLDIMASLFEQEVIGEKVEGTRFKFAGFEAVETESKLGFKAMYSSRSKYLTSKNCEELKAVTQRIYTPQTLAKEIWPDLTDAQHASLSQQLFVMTELVDDDNSELTRECS